jgi:hypothetical protein
MEILNTIRCDADGMLLTNEQRECAEKFALCRLWEDKAIAARYDELKSQELARMAKMVLATHGLPEDSPWR